jgi:hypothetical protein
MLTLPQAREETLIVREMPGEVLVYDLKNHQAHCLNQTAAFVWKSCDGLTGVPAIADMLRERIDAGLTDDVVWLALEQLERLGLLLEPVARPVGATRLSRREAVKRMGLAAAAVPLIMSVAAPTAAQAQSPCTDGSCPPGQCCSAGLCVDESECQI